MSSSARMGLPRAAAAAEIVAQELRLQRQRGRRHDHAAAGERGRDKVAEALACARARLADKRSAAREHLLHALCEGKLRPTLAIRRMRAGERPVRRKQRLEHAAQSTRRVAPHPGEEPAQIGSLGAGDARARYVDAAARGDARPRLPRRTGRDGARQGRLPLRRPLFPDPARPRPRVARRAGYVRDFLPFVALVLVYEEARGVAHLLHPHPFYEPMLTLDRWIGSVRSRPSGCRIGSGTGISSGTTTRSRCSTGCTSSCPPRCSS